MFIRYTFHVKFEECICGIPLLQYLIKREFYVSRCSVEMMLFQAKWKTFTLFCGKFT